MSVGCRMGASRGIMTLWVLGEINAAGTTILLVEQNATMAPQAAHHAHVLETGAVVRSGTGAELLGDPALRAAYLGG